MSDSRDKFRVGIDIGGTFTNLVLLGTAGHALTVKVASTPDDYSRSIAESLEVALPRIGVSGREIEEVIHRTTVATNAIPEKRGVRTGLVITAGFRDVLEIRRLRMPHLYDLTWQKPEALAARIDRVEVAERIDHAGRIPRPLDEASVHAALDRLLANSVRSITIALIDSYANDGHERRIAEMIRERGVDVPLCLSSEVNQELKECERASATVVNAYILPVVGTCLRSLDRVLRRIEIAGPLRIMQSNGGAMGVDAAAARPVNIIESGPSADVVGAAGRTATAWTPARGPSSTTPTPRSRCWRPSSPSSSSGIPPWRTVVGRGSTAAGSPWSGASGSCTTRAPCRCDRTAARFDPAGSGTEPRARRRTCGSAGRGARSSRCHRSS